MNVMLESEIRDLQDKLRHRPGTMAMRQEAVIRMRLLENMLYVSRFQNEWEMEKQELKRRAVLAYVNNISDPDNSEFGHIGISVDLTGKLSREW